MSGIGDASYSLWTSMRPDHPPPYAELHAVSNFTFLRGASHPEELVARAAVPGYAALALTDECSHAGVVRAHVAARAHDLKLIVGSELRPANGPRLVLLVTDEEGYGNLCALITKARHRAEKGVYSLARRDLDGGVRGCLTLLIPGPALESAHVRWLAQRFPERAWLAVELSYRPHDALARGGTPPKLALRSNTSSRSLKSWLKDTHGSHVLPRS
jgi:error-prone DNA polymerase